jgi:hypothetical protein
VDGNAVPDVHVHSLPHAANSDRDSHVDTNAAADADCNPHPHTEAGTVPSHAFPTGGVGHHPDRDGAKRRWA